MTIEFVITFKKSVFYLLTQGEWAVGEPGEGKSGEAWT